MSSHRQVSTTRAAGDSFVATSRKVSPSPKKRKVPGRVFGPSSQFKGVGVGVRGDVRK